MQTIQIQEFKSVSDQKIYLENIEDLEQNLNETLKLSNQTSIKQAIKKTKILFDQTCDFLHYQTFFAFCNSALSDIERVMTQRCLNQLCLWHNAFWDGTEFESALSGSGLTSAWHCPMCPR